MSRTGKKRSALELGHDSFLDIVANLVGILIILVVVLGMQSTAAIEEIKETVVQESETIPEVDRASDKQLAELAQHSMRAAAAQADSNRLEKTVKRYDAMIQRRDRERAGLLDLLATAQEAWETKKKELDQQTTQQAALQSHLQQAGEKLASLKGERHRLENQPDEIVAVAHLPTPMAKTVFGDELHFRLKENRLSVVPIDKLLDEIRREFARVISGSGQGRMQGAAGPIRGYVARYEMAKGRDLISQNGQISMETHVQLTGMEVEPLREPHGQPIDQMLQERSGLDIELAGRDPGSTTITVWVYPDSFASFRRLKEHLYKKGFATAARPLPDDRIISASPQGSRSRSQ